MPPKNRQRQVHQHISNNFDSLVKLSLMTVSQEWQDIFQIYAAECRNQRETKVAESAAKYTRNVNRGFTLRIACKNIKEVINFIAVIDSNVWVTDATDNRMINIICCSFSSLWTVSHCSVSLSSSSRLGLCLLLCWCLVSENLFHPYRTVHDKHCSVLMLVCLMPESQTQPVRRWWPLIVHWLSNAAKSRTFLPLNLVLFDFDILSRRCSTVLPHLLLGFWIFRKFNIRRNFVQISRNINDSHGCQWKQAHSACASRINVHWC